MNIRRSNSKMGVKKLYYLLKKDICKIDKSMGRDKFFDLMRHMNLLVKKTRKYVITTQSFGYIYDYKDHYNNVTLTAPHQAWVSDITYIRINDKFKYLYLITDAFSRKIVGWCLENSLEAKWAVKALEMAIKQSPKPNGIVHHSDRGIQYCSKEYTKLLKKEGITISMGKVGYCYDNAMAERVNGILKDEYLLQYFAKKSIKYLKISKIGKKYVM